MKQVYFDNAATFNEWGVYLSSIDLGDPKPKEIYVEIPNGDGALDLTEALTGDVHYESRPIEMVFTIKPETYSVQLARRIRSFLNGQRRIIRWDDEPGYHLIGRCATTLQKDGVLWLLTVRATCQPWLYVNEPTTRNVTMGAAGTITLNLQNERKRVIPTIVTSAAVTVVFDGTSTSLNAGTHRVTNIALSYGNNALTITGAAGTTVLFEFQEGAL